MLEPLDRRHLLDSLRPPAGYDLDAALGTTFSLDLMTLMTVPLSFALFDWEDENGRPRADPLALLESIRRYADRTHIFCQSGGIYLPKGNTLFLSHLEDTVHEVTAPTKGGVFHPKVWILRFAPALSTQPVLYRVLVLSRNLTFDRSWDTLLRLDGELQDRSRAIRQSKPLGEFIEALPQMMTRTPTSELRALTRRLAAEVRRVRFDLPDGFEDMIFHPMGLPGFGDWWFKGRIQRMLIVSPFLDPAVLEKLADEGENNVLISRLDQLQRVSAVTLHRFTKVYSLSQEADPVENSDDDISTDEETTALSGLHAKLYVADDGWNGRIWTGSANATSAAMRHNVEFLVELIGKKGACGVAALMSQEKNKIRFADLLSPYVPDESPPPPDTDEDASERLKLLIREALATTCIQGEVNAAVSDAARFDVVLKMSKKPRWPKLDEMELRIWPVTLHESGALPFTTGQVESVSFPNCSFESLTTFFAFEVKARSDRASITDRFVLNIPLSGLPADRRERVLRTLLRNQSQVLRFLLFLLAEDGDISSLADMCSHARASEGDPGQTIFSSISLFEAMLTALHRDPAKLDRVAHLMRDLAGSEEGSPLLPEGFKEIWEPIWAARQEVGK